VSGDWFALLSKDVARQRVVASKMAGVHHRSLSRRRYRESNAKCVAYATHRLVSGYNDGTFP
jgi:hypothetical protein